MSIAIIQFPGSNCERETMLAVKRAGMQAVEFLWNEDANQLQNMDGFIIVGGFSYEDRSRAGIIAALDPIMQELKIQSELGKPILGICNGAQILVEAGLVPGVENNQVVVALTENKRMLNDKILGTGYYNAWVQLRLSKSYQRNAFTRYLSSNDILRVPVAHAQGRFVMTNMLLQELIAQGQHVFQYCDESGNIRADFPINPNGSVENIAAISNKQGNVLAMMPHPERTPEGDPIFASMRDYIAKNKGKNKTVPLYYYSRPITKLPHYTKPLASKEFVVELIITDNQAMTVQNTLKQLGREICVKRCIHWEIDFDDSVAENDYEQQAIINKIKKSGVLFNDRKEKEIDIQNTITRATHVNFLVRAKEDWEGLAKLQVLQNHFAIQGVRAIRCGILWQFDHDPVNMGALSDDSDIRNDILKTHILFNQYAHNCYEYRCYEDRKN